MPSVIKRMRQLKELLAIRVGPGAAILPKQVKRIHLDFAAHIEGGHMGARKFWRRCMPRLKYYNPSLPMTINYTKDQTVHPILTVFYSKNYKGRGSQDLKEGLNEPPPPPHLRDGFVKKDVPSKELENATPETASPLKDATKQPEMPRTYDPDPKNWVTQAGTSENPALRPTITIDMKNRTDDEIIEELIERTGATKVEPSAAELEELRELERFKERATEDRLRTEEVNRKLKREREMLAMAMGEAGKAGAGKSNPLRK